MVDALSPADQIDLICNEFERSWSRDQSPDFELWLGRVAPSIRATLANELLAVHFVLLLQAGENPNPADFEHLGVEAIEFASNVATRLRSPSYDHTVTFDQLDIHPTADSPGEIIATRSLPSAGKAQVTEIPEQLGEFRIIRKIGQGGMGAVFEAQHLQIKTRVALKTLPNVSAETLYLFKREFRALSKISHPNLVGLHRLESDGESWFFTMDLINGTDFLSFVRPGNVLDKDRLESAYRQLVEAVSHLHARKILHRDLKPSNVMIDEKGTLKVLDFGLVFDLTTEQELKSDFVCGTPAYMSPEQITGSILTPASDWFSVGVMIFEAIEGKLPWRGGIRELMTAKLNVDAPPLHAGPRNRLSAITTRLLNRNPTDRLDPTTESEAQSSTQSVEDSSKIREGILFGRESQFDKLRNIYQNFLDSGKPTVAFVSGRSGEGKTHLTEQFINSIRANTISILSGRCYDRESVPYKAIDHLIESLSAFLAERSGIDLEHLLPKDIGILAQVFPSFLRLPEVDAVNRRTPIPQDSREVRKRAFLAFRELVQTISAEKPLLLFLDDMQWGDAESAELIREIIRTPDGPQILLLMTYRSDEADTSAFLNYWKNSRDDELSEHEVEIGPLSKSEITKLVERYVDRNDVERFARVVGLAEETDGNPFLLVEFLESVESAGSEVKIRPLAEVIVRKLGALPNEAKSILEFSAVSGQAIRLDDIADAYGADRLPMETVYRMQNENLLRQVGEDENLRFDTYHDKVRETILSNFDVDYKARLHKRMAQVIEEKIGGFPDDVFNECAKQKNKTFDEEIQLKPVSRVYDLSYHYDEAGETELAARYSFVAAFQAKSQFSLEVAVAQFEIFDRNSKDLPQSIKFQAGEAHGFSLLRIGEFDQSDRQLQKTMAYASDELERGRLASLRAEACFEVAQFERGRVIAEDQLRALNVFLPKNKWVRSSFGLATVLSHIFYAQFLERFSRRKREWTDAAYVKYELFRKLIFITFYINTPLHISTFCRSAQQVARWKYNWSVADFEGVGAFTYSILGLARVAEQKSQRAREFSEASNDARLLGNIKFGHSVVELLDGKFVEHDKISSESTMLAGQTGDLWKTHANQSLMIISAGKRGDLIKAVQTAKQSIRSQLRRGTKAYALDAAYFWIIATRGDAPYEELLELCEVDIDNALQKSIQAHARINRYLFQGRYQDAYGVACESIGLARFSQCLGLFSISLYPGFVKASCELVKHEPKMATVQRKRVLARAMKESKRGLAHTKTMLLDRAWALREHAELLRLLGKFEKAGRFASESCELARKQGARVDLIFSQLTLAQIRRDLDRPDAEDMLRQAEVEVAEFRKWVQEANNGAMEFIESMREQFV